MATRLHISADEETGFCHEHALILYVYLENEESGADDSVLTVSWFIPLLPIPPEKISIAFDRAWQRCSRANCVLNV